MRGLRQTVKVPTPRRVKRRTSAVTRVLFWTLLLGLFVAAAGVAGLAYAYREFAAAGPLATPKVFNVEPGLSVPAIGAALEREGIISNGRIFAIMVQVTGQRRKLKAGEYEIRKGASMRDVMALMASGRSIAYKITIPEGFTSEMAVARVNANEILSGPPAIVPPEGTILPDTYVFRRGMSRQKLVDTMVAAQTKLLEQLWAARTPVAVIETPEQAVTLASIVEKETAVPDERPVIASVFINRLNKGMRLQSDPTIIYGIVGGAGRLDRSLTRDDIEAVTPYNTYRIDGLPPGPIANPGRAALEAVLNPQPTDYFYFVADGSGGHAFSVTLEEHNRNVRLWRKIAGNAAAAVAADEGEPGAETAVAGEPAPVPVPMTQAADGPLAGVVPEPEDTQATANSVPAPPQPPKKPAPPETDGETLVVTLEPGTIFTVNGRKAVIPRLRPAR